ncbi:MAG: TonB family protein [Polyangiales bacterium]
MTVSVAAHALLFVLARLAPAPAPPAPPAPDALRVTEFELPPPVAAAAPTVPAATPPPPAAVAPPAPRAAPPAVTRSLPAPRGTVAVAPAPEATPAPPAPVAPAPSPATTSPSINANEVLRASNRAAFDAWSRGAVVLTAVGDGHTRRDLIQLPQGTPEERARRASTGYIREQLAATHQHDAPGVRGYFWSLRRRMTEIWRPGVAREPSLGDALLAGVAMPVAAMRDVLRNAAGAAAEPGRQGAAADALDGHRGNDPTARNVTPYTGIVDASHGTATRTRAEVEVVQDAQGNVVSVRVVRSARVAGFDEAALHAVREALPLQAAVPMPGGRRSRWSFEVVASRDPIMPGVGFSFDESSGWFELHYPGRLHLRSRVWLEGASPLGG